MVNVYSLGMVGNDAMVGLCSIEILDEMIPNMPLPNHLIVGGIDFQNHVRPQLSIGEFIWVATSGNSFS